MTREEALKEFIGYQTYDIQPSVEATKMAIKALELIPDNATNGDVIKALFPDVNIMRGVGTNYAGLAVKGKDITADWIDAPYKSESDESADTFEKLLNSGFYESTKGE